MSFSEESYQGRVGRKLFLINARDARLAVALALEFSPDHFFTTEKIIHDAYPVEYSPLSSEKPFAPFEGLEGAWAILVARVGHAWSSSGSEYDSDYHIESIEFERSAPHPTPHCKDDARHWAAVRLSLDEQSTLKQETKQAPIPNRFKKNPKSL